ncbi:IclR family transcriptional regulator [Rhodococcus sp. HNM0569]|uniref:IclR family transcriptional regulator n=1 Tax=Rhodococcus sp. HNM0569 TaxID=2716340 RepID=UPI00146A2592|nr:IclR family transcriptional regulator [Rhodococcus sp. HNM0569]NLU84303.1 IclR family transcriptional regulator [Rhodococcus sp. HNM0569]
MVEVSKTTDQALEVLEFLGQRGSLSIAEAARELDLSRTVAYRLLSTLEQRGFVKRNEGIYRLGPKLFALAQHVEWAVRDAAHPHMRVLVDELRETVVLSLRDGGQTLSMHRVANREHFVQISYPPGLRYDLADTVGGRVILAHLEPDEQLQILGDPDHPLLPELGRIRRRGYAMTKDEEAAGMSGLAVPIRSMDGVVACLTVYTPTERTADVKARHEVVVRAADAISQELLEN